MIGQMLAAVFSVGAMLGGLSSLGAACLIVVGLLLIAFATLLPLVCLSVEDAPETASDTDARQLLNSL